MKPTSRNNSSLIFWVAVLILTTSCQQKDLGPAQWLKWAEDPECQLKKQAVRGGIKYMVMYKPYAYLYSKALLSHDTILLKRISDQSTLEFNIRMEPQDGKTNVLTIGTNSREDAFSRISYYNAAFEKDIKLLLGKDTLYPNNFIYERYYNLSPAQTVVVGFTVSEEMLQRKQMKLLVRDEVARTGEMEFVYDESLWSTMPKLKI